MGCPFPGSSVSFWALPSASPRRAGHILLLPPLQTQLACAAQHIFWSSIYGGVLGDDGRYDAFETVMEILRVKLLYPDLEPGRYVEKDEAFRRFMHCGRDEGARHASLLIESSEIPWFRMCQEVMYLTPFGPKISH